MHRPIPQNDLSNVSHITLMINDKERELQNDYIGYCTIGIDTNNQNLQDFNENILSKTGVRLQSFLHFRVKLVLSQVNKHKNLYIYLVYIIGEDIFR